MAGTVLYFCSGSPAMKYNVFDANAQIIGAVSAPTGDIAFTLAQIKYADRARNVLLHPDEIPRIKRNVAEANAGYSIR